jgi:outer membrane protein assembly factor BamB
MNKLWSAGMVVVTVVTCHNVFAEDWPRWRGPRGDGTWHAPKLPTRWPAGGLPQRWRQSIGAGFSGVVVADNAVVTMDRPEPTKKDRVPDGLERILCFEAATGKLRWTHSYAAHYGDLDYGTGPRAAPAIHDGRVYTLGAVGMVTCLELATGKLVFQKDLGRQRAGRVSDWWGYAASPLIVGDLVVIHAGAEPNGCLVAFDRKTGDEVWRSLPDPAGYATPTLVHSPSGPQLVVWTPENVHGLHPQTGAVFWSVPYKVTYGVSIATPIYYDQLVFVTGYWEGSKAIRLGARPQDAELVWQENRFLRGLMAPPLYRDGFVYSLDKQFGLTCFELRTGRKHWDDGNRMTPAGRNPQATFVWINDADRILALNSEGQLILARINPQGYFEDSRTRIIGPTWANPAFAGDAVFARNDRELVCVALPHAAN